MERAIKQEEKYSGKGEECAELGSRLMAIKRVPLHALWHR